MTDPEIQMALQTTLITAGVTLLISAISGILTIVKIVVDKKQAKQNRNLQKQIAKSAEEAENNRTKIQIDANVVWEARVEWIQSVRNITAELITTVNIYLHAESLEEQKQNLEVINEKCELLILFFGPDKHTNADVNILDKSSNESKNEQIVKLIKKIYEESAVYYLKKQWIEEAQIRVDLCQQCKKGDDVYRGCGTYDENISEESQSKKCSSDLQYNLEEIHKYACENNELLGDLSTLTEVMRIYLKIEWNRAKERTSL